MTAKGTDSPVVDEVANYVRLKLAEFSTTDRAGVITVDVTISHGEPTGISTTSREHLKMPVKRERFK